MSCLKSKRYLPNEVYTDKIGITHIQRTKQTIAQRYEKIYKNQHFRQQITALF